MIRTSVLWALTALCAAAGAETLEEAWQSALGDDLTLQAAEARIAAADAAYAAARAERRPALTAGGGVTRFDEAPAFDFSSLGMPAELALFGGQTLSLADARLSMPIFTAGRIGSGIDAAAAGIAVRQADAAALTLNVKLAVTERYVGVLRAESAVAVSATNAEGLAAHARDVEDMFRSGAVPRNDFLAASVSLANARQQESQARNALEIARATYNRTIGRDLDTEITLEPTFPETYRELGAQPLANLVALAYENRHELDGLDAAVRGLTAQSTAARAARRPQLAVNGGYTFLGNDFLNQEDFWTIGIGVQWNAFDSGRSRNSASALAHEASATARERDNLLTVIELQVRATWLDVRETRERISVTEDAVAQAEENLRVVRDRYLNGEGTNTEVLDAETLRSTSRSNFDTARYDAALAEFRLARAVGRL